MSRLILPTGMAMPNPSDVDAASGWERVANDVVPNGETFVHRGRQLLAIREIEEGRWHLSVSHRDRIPTWGELGVARDALLPADAWMMVPHPPRAYWMNLNPKVLHLHEFRNPHLIQRFKDEGEAARQGGYNRPDSGGM